MKTSALSLMPEEIEKQFTPQEIADLFAFLCLDKPPSDPTAKPLPGAGPILSDRNDESASLRGSGTAWSQPSLMKLLVR